MIKNFLSFIFIGYGLLTSVFAQQKVWSSSDIQVQLEKLNVLGSVLYFAAHPDDENTRLIAWLAQEKKYKTAYLSLTRGEGGQNLIGTDLGIDLGLIRTQELLAARALDKGEQFFSSAYDFGFSKTYEETFKFWDKEQTLADAVYIIRKLRPDVIINRFPPDRRGGHGHHQASAILAHEAFIAAADPTRFPEQLALVEPWQAKRLLWNTANFGGMNNTSEDQLKIDIGAYNPLLGQSYGEIAARSRSQHKSQGFGAAATRGQSFEYFEHVDGTEATKTLMDDVNTTWTRIAGTEAIQEMIRQINTKFDSQNPEYIVPDLFVLRNAIAQIDDTFWKEEKIKEVENLIVACAGIWVEATATRPTLPVSQAFDVTVEIMMRRPLPSAEVIDVEHVAQAAKLTENHLWQTQISYQAAEVTQPYWLTQQVQGGNYKVELAQLGQPTNKIKPQIETTIRIGDNHLVLRSDIQYRSVDPVHGEVYRDVAIIPALTVDIATPSLLFTNMEQKYANITFHNHHPTKKQYTVSWVSPATWSLSDEVFELDFSQGNTVTKTVAIRPKSKEARQANLRLVASGDTLTSIKTLNYTHIPAQVHFPTADISLRYVELQNPVKKVGYIPGAGDLVASSLANIGIEVATLADHQIQADYLAQFDAVVVGVRFFNVNDKSAVALTQLLRYVEQGGVVLSQYNVNTRLQTAQLGPHPFRLTRDRVTEEDAEVAFDTQDLVFNYPNKITKQDFEGWVQERGLYFAVDVDAEYRTPLRMHDTGEASHKGSLLITKYGKGKFVYTSLSFFRQLPAGVPGAYRLFVNLLAKEK